MGRGVGADSCDLCGMGGDCIVTSLASCHSKSAGDCNWAAVLLRQPSGRVAKGLPSQRHISVTGKWLDGFAHSRRVWTPKALCRSAALESSGLDIARCHAKRHHVEHARFRSSGRRSRHRPRLAQQHREQRRPWFWTAARVVRLGTRSVSATATCAHRLRRGPNSDVQLFHTLNVNGGMVTAAGVVAGACFRRPEQEQQIEQQPHAGPFAGPKPEPMTVPRGASRSNRRGASESARVGARIPSKLVMRVRFSSPALSDVPSQGERTGPGPQRGPLVSGPSTGPLSPSFPVGHASSILVTHSTAAFLVVALSGLAASSA
jgi:hypothetical protein